MKSLRLSLSYSLAINFILLFASFVIKAADLPDQFTTDNLTNSRIAIGSIVQDGWTTNFDGLYTFDENNSGSSSSNASNSPFSWQIDAGEAVLSFEPSLGFLIYVEGDFSEEFGQAFDEEVNALSIAGEYSSGQIPVQSQATLALRVDKNVSPAQLVVERTIKQTVMPPEGITFVNGNVSEATTSYSTLASFNPTHSSEIMASISIEGEWAIPIWAEIALFQNGNSTYFYELVSFMPENQGSGLLSEEEFDWVLTETGLTLSHADFKIEYEIFAQNNNAYFAVVKHYIENTLQAQFAASIYKKDASANTFVENLVTEYPNVISADINSWNSSGWDEQGQRIFGSASCCFVHKFNENGTVKFGIQDDVDKFSIPNDSFYQVENGRVSIVRNNARKEIRSWFPISTDSNGRTAVLEFSAVTNEDLGAGQLIFAPRISTYSTIDLSQFDPEYQNTGFSSLAFTLEELTQNVFYYLVQEEECPTTDFYMESLSFDETGYSLDLCNGVTETGTYSLLDSGIIELQISPTESEYIRRTSRSGEYGSYTECWGESLEEVLACGQDDEDEVFLSLENAQSYLSSLNQPDGQSVAVSFSYVFEANASGTAGHVLSGIAEGVMLDDNDTIEISGFRDVSLNGIPYTIDQTEIGIRAADPIDTPVMSLSGDNLDFWVCGQGFKDFYENGGGDCSFGTDGGFLIGPYVDASNAQCITESEPGICDVWAWAGIPEYSNDFRDGDIMFVRSNWKAQIVDDGNSIFDPNLFLENTIVVHDKTRENWAPVAMTLLEFDDQSSGRLSELVPGPATHGSNSFEWYIAGSKLYISESAKDDILFIDDSIIDIFGQDTATELFELRDNAELSFFVDVSKVTVYELDLVSANSEQLDIKGNYTNIYTLLLPEGTTIQSTLFGSDSSTIDAIMRIDTDFDDSLIVGDNAMLGDWAISMPFDLPVFPNLNPERAYYTNFVTLQDNGSALSEFFDTQMTWEETSTGFSLFYDTYQIDIQPFTKVAKQLLSVITVWKDNEEEAKYVSAIAQSDNSYTGFTNDLVTRLPVVFNHSFSSELAASWENDVLSLGVACCFVSQFASDGSVLFGISYSENDEVFSNPRISTYEVTDRLLSINRNLGSDVRFGLRSFRVLSVDDNGNALVVYSSLRFDSSNPNNSEELGTGYLIRPRLQVLHKIDLSVYGEVYQNSTFTILEGDFDMDGIIDSLDPDDDNDGLPDTFELANGLDSFNPSDADLDMDNDLLTNLEEFVLGTDIDNADTDNDGYTDNIDTNPLTFDEVDQTLYTGQLYVLPDMTNDGVQEMGILSVTDDSVTVSILNGKTEQEINVVSWPDIYIDTTLTLHVLADQNGNSASELGVFGVQDTGNNAGKPQMFVRDMLTGNRVTVYNWPANWRGVSLKILSDLSGDGVAEVAIQGRFKVGNRPQLLVKNGATGGNLRTFGYPNILTEPVFFEHSDITGDGVAEISTFGRITRNNKIQVKVANGLNAQDRLKAYNFPDKWDNVSWHRLDDSNADGQDDWGLFGTNKQDGRPQLIVKSGTDPRGALRIHAWPSDMNNATFYTIADMNNDGIDEVAAAGRRSNGRYQFQVQDGADRNIVLANHNLNLNTAALSLSNVSYHVLPDLNSDGQAEIGFMGIDTDGNYQLIIRQGDAANGELTRHNLGSDWASNPNISSLGDTDDDDIPNLLIYGQDGSQGIVKTLNL